MHASSAEPQGAARGASSVPWGHSFQLCGLIIRLTCDELEELGRVTTLWRGLFRLGEPHSSPTAPDIAVHFGRPGAPLARPAPAERIVESAALEVWKTERGFYRQCGASALDLDLAAGRAVGVLDERFWARSLTEQREFFLVALLMLLRRHGRYAIHASAAVRKGIGCLIVGRSGRGKTTLTLALVRRGWRYLSDDALVLRRGPDEVEALAFRRGFSCTPTMAAHFPELRSAATTSVPLSGGKWLLDPEQVYPGRFSAGCSPRILLFPEIVGDRRSHLLPLDQAAAVASLIAQSAGISGDRRSVGEQVQLLGRLVRQAPSYRLLLGADVHEDASAVHDLILEAAGTKEE